MTATGGILRLFLCGDVMTGRGIDQILPHPCPPRLYESFVGTAEEYVRIAEATNGPIPKPVSHAYVWGAALDELNRAQPDLRIVNLETSITRSEDYAPKGINYRMSPENAECLRAARIDCCVLANNHVLDWGQAGLRETLCTLDNLHIARAGAGRDLAEAGAPAVLDAGGKGRVLLLALACTSSGTPREWAATEKSAGLYVVPELSANLAGQIADRVETVRRAGDIVVVSIHWGPNWGYDIPAGQREFAHALIDRAGVSIVHGHSSHHAKAIEIYKGRLVLYGCGDFLNDYEGISGYEEFRDDLALMYFAGVDPADGNLASLEMTPLLIRRFQLTRAPAADAAWIGETLDRESGKFGVQIEANPAGRLMAVWRN